MSEKRMSILSKQRLLGGKAIGKIKLCEACVKEKN